MVGSRSMAARDGVGPGERCQCALGAGAVWSLVLMLPEERETRIQQHPFCIRPRPHVAASRTGSLAVSSGGRQD